MLYQSTCVGFGYGLYGGYFQEPRTLPAQSNKSEQNLRSVTSSWPTNIHVVPIGYAVSASP